MVTLRQLSYGIRKGRCKYTRVSALCKGPFRRGVIYRLDIISPRKPNSAKRKIAKVRVLLNMRRVFCHIPGVGNHYLNPYSSVIVKGRPKGKMDSPGVNYSLVRGLLDFERGEDFGRRNKRSKYGRRNIKRDFF